MAVLVSLLKNRTQLSRESIYWYFLTKFATIKNDVDYPRIPNERD